MSYNLKTKINPEILPLLCNPEPNVQHSTRSVVNKNNITFKHSVVSTDHLMLLIVFSTFNSDQWLRVCCNFATFS
jgi:hypothetical protein